MSLHCYAVIYDVIYDIIYAVIYDIIYDVIYDIISNPVIVAPPFMPLCRSLIMPLFVIHSLLLHPLCRYAVR